MARKKATWNDNPARAIILSDLENDRVPLDEKDMNAEQVFNEYYKHNGIVQAVGLKEFKKRLKDHRKQVRGRRENPKKKKGFKWKKSEARCMVIEDLTRGILSLENDAREPEEKWESYYKYLPEYKDVAFETFKEYIEKTAMSAEEAWLKYKPLEPFKEVEFQQFKNALARHRAQVKAHLKRSMQEERMLRQDLKLFPPKSKRADGTPLWDSHPAKYLLREDVAAMKHTKMKPSQLRLTRDEYKEFGLKEFRQHVYQENRRRRFCNWLNDRRQKEKKIHCCKPPVGPNDNTLEERLSALELDEAVVVDEHMNVDDGQSPPEVVATMNVVESRKRQNVDDEDTNIQPPYKRTKL